MENRERTIGLVSYGFYLPKNFETAAEIAERAGLSREQVVRELGIERKCLPGAEDQPMTMAVQASL
ncbi:MAG: hypothetical protein NTY64_08580, partial [Deltaproteobacteria bacterium]|nr:hypothetical protein [Deltaproteobacteria bacterium]